MTEVSGDTKLVQDKKCLDSFVDKAKMEDVTEDKDDNRSNIEMFLDHKKFKTNFRPHGNTAVETTR